MYAAPGNVRAPSGRPSLRPTGGGRRSAYTLVELVVVIGVIALLVGVTIPSVNMLFEGNRLADADAKLKGLLTSARNQAIHQKERGLFFFVDAQGVQKIAPIEAETGSDFGPDDIAHTPDDLPEAAAADRFRVVGDRVYEIHPPYRVTHAGVLDINGPWNENELGNENYINMATEELEYHRNFFTVVFGRDGLLRVGRAVLIHDDPLGPVMLNSLPKPAQHTGLLVQDTTNFHPLNRMAGGEDDIGGTLSNMVTDIVGSAAFNFPSVEALLLYDDSQFRTFPQHAVAPAENQRDFLRRTARPFYISRQTGHVLRGPLGEN